MLSQMTDCPRRRRRSGFRCTRSKPIRHVGSLRQGMGRLRGQGKRRQKEKEG